MNYKILFILVAMNTIYISGCASFDKSMASDAVDIPDDTPPPLAFSSPTPLPASDSHGQQMPVR